MTVIFIVISFKKKTHTVPCFTCNINTFIQINVNHSKATATLISICISPSCQVKVDPVLFHLCCPETTNL